MHEQPCGLQEDDVCVPLSGGVARKASLHAPATDDQAFGLKSATPQQASRAVSLRFDAFDGHLQFAPLVHGHYVGAVVIE